MSPRGTASTQVLGTWTKAERSFAVGGGRYDGGKWIDILYGRPLKRQREIFGSGADYGKATLIGAPILACRRRCDDANQDRGAARHQQQDSASRRVHACSSI